MANLGDKVRDKISGFEGIVFGRIEYLFGCVQLDVVSQTERNDGKPASVWFDEGRVIVLEENAIDKVEVVTGGPMTNPPSRNLPNR